MNDLPLFFFLKKRKEIKPRFLYVMINDKKTSVLSVVSIILLITLMNASPGPFILGFSPYSNIRPARVGF